MKLTEICGIPVRLQFHPRVNQTLIFSRRSDKFTVTQKQLINDYLSSLGHEVLGQQWSYLPVRGTVTVNH
jgi:hypothetical protein